MLSTTLIRPEARDSFRSSYNLSGKITNLYEITDDITESNSSMNTTVCMYVANQFVRL